MSDFFDSQGSGAWIGGHPGEGGPSFRMGAQRRRGPRIFAKFEDFGGPGWGDEPGRMHAHGHGGPPWRAGRRMRRGDIRWALLLELLDGPGHGYELIGRLESRSGGMWRPSAGSVYPTLQMLEDEGLIAGRDQDGKRVFELTDDGRDRARAAKERAGQAGPWSGGTAGPHFELRKSMKTLVLAVRQVVVAGDEAQVSGAVAAINQARQRIYHILASDLRDGGGAADEAVVPGGDERESPQ